MISVKHIVFSVVFLFISVSVLFANDGLPPPMQPYRLVNDFAKVFKASEANKLKDKLGAFQDSTGNQVFVVTVNSLDGEVPYNYASRLINKWGIGQKGKDNGVLILIKPKIKNERGEVFIAPGYGLEAALNDAFLGRIIDNQMIPHLKKNDYYLAADDAIDVLLPRIQNVKISDKKPVNSTSSYYDIKQSPVEKKSFWDGIVEWICPISFCLYFIIAFITNLKGGGKRGGGQSRNRSSRSSSSSSSSSNSDSSSRSGGGGRSGGAGAGRSW